MPTFWITINSADLWCLFVIRLVGVEFDLGSDVAFVFAHKITTINPVAVVKFFYIICQAILQTLFASEHRHRDWLGSVLTYFGTIKTNGRNMLYLYYLFWLKKASHLLTLHGKIYKNKDFCMRLLAFLEYIIKCSAKDNAFFGVLHHTCFDTHEANTIKDFTI